jgi:diaminohydroxyphosphoribosylaminopyrimidine deaminase/5-amino-6-(5-phosphoribosylamino)uracil reductase
MTRALALAERGLYTTAPNPRVGCVLAHGDQVVGEGAHERAGEPHAEVHALREAGERARGATAYVTLEPCAHQGRTGPCADALIAAGVARVVAAIEDPFPEVAGKGLAKLREVGVAVEVGLLRDAARDLNRGFFSRIERGRPWIRVKLASSVDGRTALADGRSKWITGEAARLDNMYWRARSSAILTGVGTVLADDPQLNVRADDVASVPPLRVILDSRLRTPPGAHVLDGTQQTLIYHAPEATTLRAAIPGVEFKPMAATHGRISLTWALRDLGTRALNEVQVEAGPILSGALLYAGLVDEVLLYVNPSVLGYTARALFALPPLADLEQRPRFKIVDNAMLGEDLRLVLRPT